MSRCCQDHWYWLPCKSAKGAAVNKMPREHYLNSTYGIRSRLLTTDHKRIALLYLVSVTFFFFIGGAFATMIRIHLLTLAGDRELHLCATLIQILHCLKACRMPFEKSAQNVPHIIQ